MKFYTIESLNPSEENLIGAKVTELCRNGIFLKICLMMREELDQLGITILNKSEIPYSIEWRDQNKTETDVLDYIEKIYQLRLHEVVASIDFNKIIPIVCEKFNLIPITEEVLSRCDDTSQIDEKIKTKLNDMIQKEKTSILTIIDPWFFKIDSEQQNRLMELFKSANVKTVRVYFERKDRVSQENFKEKLNSVDISLESKLTDEFHDRFWIVGNSGFCTGTSYNGLGKKVSLLKELDPEEVQSIIDILKTCVEKSI